MTSLSINLRSCTRRNHFVLRATDYSDKTLSSLSLSVCSSQDWTGQGWQPQYELILQECCFCRLGWSWAGRGSERPPARQSCAPGGSRRRLGIEGWTASVAGSTIIPPRWLAIVETDRPESEWNLSNIAVLYPLLGKSAAKCNFGWPILCIDRLCILQTEVNV